jgi:protocatechuate 3,4-dioxygenase beta subunit
MQHLSATLLLALFSIPAASAPPIRITGRVLEAVSRKPVAGALVWNGDAGGMAWMPAGPGGMFELRVPSGDRGRIGASAPGYMVHFQSWNRNRNAALTFLLEPAAPIAGQVVDEAGRPVAGVDSRAPVRLVLRRGALVIGRIVDEEHGLPLAGVRVSLTAREAGAPNGYQPLQATTDPEGRFEIPWAGSGRHTLRTEIPGFVTMVVEDLLVPEQQPEVDLGEIRLQAGAVLEGIVTDALGRPVEAAWVRVMPSYGSADFAAAAAALSAWQPIVTGGDGRFRIEGLPRGATFDIDVDHSELLPGESLGVEVPTAEPLRIRLDLPRTLSGRVVDSRGEPVAGAAISPNVSTVLPGKNGRSRGRSWETARTDRDGRFRLSRLMPGPVDLYARAPGYRTGQLPVQVPEEGEAEPVEIVLEVGASLEGRVLDSKGLPVHNASVQAGLRIEELESGYSSLATVRTGEEGRYEVLNFQPGTCEVQVFLPEGGGSFRAVAKLGPGRNRLDLRAPRGVQVAGRVVDGRGEPLPGASVSLKLLEPGAVTQGPERTSAADGTFVLADVLDGEYRLTVSRPGFVPLDHPGGIRIHGAPVSDLELRLSPGAVIRGRILGDHPEEARLISVRAWSEGIAYPLEAILGPGRAYRFVDVPPGEWRVLAEVAPGRVVEGTVEVAEGVEEVVLDLTLSSWR